MGAGRQKLCGWVTHISRWLFALQQHPRHLAQLQSHTPEAHLPRGLEMEGTATRRQCRVVVPPFSARWFMGVGVVFCPEEKTCFVKGAEGRKVEAADKGLTSMG